VSFSTFTKPRKPLHRTGFPGPQSQLKRGKPMAKRSAKRQAAQASWNEITRRKLAIGMSCEYCGVPFLKNAHPLHKPEGHHRLPRSQGGLDVETNHLLVHSICNSNIHIFSRDSYEFGWLLHRHDAPASIGGTKPEGKESHGSV
jgi:hypothetical protein